jgi:hypothetical protein
MGKRYEISNPKQIQSTDDQMAETFGILNLEFSWYLVLTIQDLVVEIATPQQVRAQNYKGKRD